MGASSYTPAIEKDAAFEALKAAPDCINILSASGRIEFINEHGLLLVEFDSADEVIGRSYLDVWPVDMDALIQQALLGAAQGNHTYVEGLRSTLKGKGRWWDASREISRKDVIESSRCRPLKRNSSMIWPA